MEPIAILGVVGNAIQLVDFAMKLVSKTRSLQRSGTLVEQEDLLLVSKDLASLSNTLKADLEPPPPGITENDIATRSLCGKCLEVALEIETALAETKKKGTFGRWKSFRQALKAIWGAEKLADMQGRLVLFSQQLQQRTQIKTHQAVTDMHLDIIRALKDITTSSTKDHEATRLIVISLQREAEQQAAQLKDEIKQLRLDLEQRISESIIKSEHASKAERSRLHEFTNATYKLWAAKEVMLANIMCTISAYGDGDRIQTPKILTSNSFKIQAYPKTRNESEHSARFALDSLSRWITEGNIFELERCLKEGADPNAVSSFKFKSSRRGDELINSPPLIAALCQDKGWAEATQVLLEYGANPHGQDSAGVSIYSYALGTKDPQTIKILVTALARIQEKPVVRSPPQIRPPSPATQHIAWNDVLAFSIDNEEGAQRLIRGDGSLRTIENARCLQLATIFCNLGAVRRFIRLGTPLHKCSVIVPTALAIALAKGYADIAKEIVDSSPRVPHDKIWYEWLYGATFNSNDHESSLNSAYETLIEQVLDIIPHYEGLIHATEFQKKAWASRIASKLVLELSPNLHTRENEHLVLYNTSPQGRRGSWKLLGRTFDQQLSRDWIFEVRLPHEWCGFPELSKAFAKKIISYIDNSPVAVGFHTMRYRKVLQWKVAGRDPSSALESPTVSF